MGEQHERGLPKYVEHELRAYLKCGIRSHTIPGALDFGDLVGRG